MWGRMTRLYSPGHGQECARYSLGCFRSSHYSFASFLSSPLDPIVFWRLGTSSRWILCPRTSSGVQAERFPPPNSTTLGTVLATLVGSIAQSSEHNRLPV